MTASPSWSWVLPDNFNESNFGPVKITDKKGEVRDAYEITRDGYAFLVGSWTGKKAAKFREAYINAFNAMEAELMKQKAEPAQPVKLMDSKTVRGEEVPIDIKDVVRLGKADIGDTKVDAVDARELHTFLGSGRQFADWIKRKVLDNPFFEKGVDYIVFNKVIENPVNKGGRPPKDYLLTMDTAKKVSMSEQTARGEEARNYFLDCEKKSKAVLKTLIPDFTDPVAAARAWADEVEGKKLLEAKVVEDAPILESFRQQVDVSGFSTVLRMIALVKINKEGKVTTTSRDVAERFGKDHKNVIRDIEKILKTQDVAAVNFDARTYSGGLNGNTDIPYYEMNRDGFSLLVMGFTGEKALQFKLDFIQAFNVMEEELIKSTVNPGYISENKRHIGFKRCFIPVRTAERCVEWEKLP